MLEINTKDFSPGPDNPDEFRPDNIESNLIASLEQIQSSILFDKSTNSNNIPTYSQQDVCYSIEYIRKSLENDCESELIIRSNNGFQILSTLIQATDNPTIIEHTFQSLIILSQNFSTELSLYLDYERIVKFIISEMNLQTRKSALSLITNVSSRNPTESIINEILKLQEFEDLSTQISVSMIISNVFEGKCQEPQSKESIQYMINHLSIFQSKTRDRCLSSLTKITENIENTIIILNSDIDFEQMLHLQNLTQENQKQILKLILALLPESKRLEPLGHPKNKRPELSLEFAAYIQPILKDLILERPISPHLSLLALAASLTCNSIEFDLNDILISNLLFYATNENLAPYVLAVFSSLYAINKQRNIELIKNGIEQKLFNQNNFENDQQRFNQSSFENKQKQFNKNKFEIKKRKQFNQNNFESEHFNQNNFESEQLNQSGFLNDQQQQLNEIDFENYSENSEQEDQLTSENSEQLFECNNRNYPEVYHVLSSIKVKPQISKWYNEGIKHLKLYIDEERINFDELDLEQITSMITQNEISPIEYIYGKGSDRVLEILQSKIESIENNDEETHKQLKIDEEKFQHELLIISEFSKNNLQIYPLSCNYGSNSYDEFQKILLSNGNIQIILPSEKTIQVNAPLQSPISLIEGLINSEMYEYNSENIINQIKETELNIQQMLNLSYPLKASQLSLLYRATNSSYPAMKLTNGTKSYTIHDSLFSIFCDNEQKKTPLYSEKDENLQNESITTKSTKPKFKELKLYFFTSLFKILSILSINFEIDTICEVFVEKVRNSLSYPFNSIGRLSSNMSLIFKYPFLFPTELRILAFKLVAFDPLSALQKVIQEFVKDSEDNPPFPKQSPLKIIVSRSKIFEDGIKYLKLFAQNKIPVEVQFQGETATGPGPTQEFFSLLSEEFKKRNIFRFDISQGLFPSPDADPEMFEFLGILVAKALSQDCLTDLQFNPAFFEKLRGIEISLDQVDQALDNSLSQDIIGNSFELPGYPNVKMKLNENQEEEDQNEDINVDIEFKNILKELKNIVNNKINSNNDEIIEQLNYSKNKNRDFDQLIDMCQIQMQLFQNNHIKINKNASKLKFNSPQIQSVYNIQQSQFMNDFFVTMKLNKKQKQKFFKLNKEFMKLNQKQNKLFYNNQNRRRDWLNQSFDIRKQNKILIQQNQNFIQQFQQNFNYQSGNSDSLNLVQNQFEKLLQQNPHSNSKQFEYQNESTHQHQQFDLTEQKQFNQQPLYKEQHQQFDLITQQQQQQRFINEQNNSQQQLEEEKVLLKQPQQQQQQFIKEEDSQQQQQFINVENNSHQQQFDLLKHPQQQQFIKEEDSQQQQFDLLGQPQKQQQGFIHQKDDSQQQFEEEDSLEQPRFFDQQNNSQQQFEEENSLEQPRFFDQQNNSQQQFEEENSLEQPRFFDQQNNSQQQQQFDSLQQLPAEHETRKFTPFTVNQQQQQQYPVYQHETDYDKPIESNITESNSLCNDEENYEKVITSENEDEFRHLVYTKMTGSNIEKCCRMFEKGFSSVIPFELTECFTSEELSLLIGGEIDPITYEDLISNVDLIDFNQNDEQIKNLFEMIVKMNQYEQRNFFRFVTASNNLPIGGLKELRPHFTIAKCDCDFDSAYPTVSTCTNLLKLPPFSSKENQERRLRLAIQNNGNSFQLG